MASELQRCMENNIADLIPLAMIALSVVQSSTRIPIHNSILFINPSIILGTTMTIG